MQKKKFEKKADDFKKAEPKKEFKSEPKKEFKRNTSLLIITRMQKLRKHLRLKHSHSLRKSHLQQNRRKLLRRILKEFLNNMFGAMSMEVKADITFDDEEK